MSAYRQERSMLQSCYIACIVFFLAGVGLVFPAQASEFDSLPVYDRSSSEEKDASFVAGESQTKVQLESSSEKQAQAQLEQHQRRESAHETLEFPSLAPLHPFQTQGPYNPAGYQQASADADYILGTLITHSRASYLRAPHSLAPIAFVIRADENELFTRHIDDVTPMASLTKMTALLLALKTNDNLDKICTISENAVSIGGNVMGYKAGTQLSLRELMQGMFIHSGNDSAIALAENLGGSVEAYCMRMTELAKELGCNSSQFVTPHGLDRPGHYSSGRDSFIIAKELMNYAFSRETASCSGMDFNINGEIQHFPSTNELIDIVEGVKGVKTGFTLQAGYCLLTYVQNGQAEFYTLVMGLNSKESRNLESKKLIDWAFRFYPQKELVSSQQSLGYLPYGLRFGSYLPAHISISVGYRQDILKPKDINYTGQIRQQAFQVTEKNSPVGKLFIHVNGRDNYERNIYSGLKPQRLCELAPQSYFTSTGRFRALGTLSL